MSLVSLLLTLAALSPQDQESPTEQPIPTLTLEAAGWIARPSGNIYITRGSRAGTATTARVDHEIDPEVAVTPLLEARLRFWGEHAVGVRFMPIRESGSQTPTSDFIYHGTLFPAGRKIQTDLRLTLVDVDYQYTWTPAEDFRLTAHAGMEFWDFAGKVKTVDSGPPLDTTRGFSSAFWLLGVEGEIRLSEQWRLNLFAAGGMERSQQNFYEIEGSIVFTPWAHVGLTAGYLLHRIRFYQSTNQSNLGFDGPTLGVVLRF
jgi:hypothetical protein